MSSTKPSERLDFLLANICHLHHARARQQLEALKLYRGQPPVLHALWQKEGRTQTELADKLEIAPATLTKMLQRMERAGFIYRQVDKEDQRVSRVFLTEAGRAIQSQVEQIWDTMENESFANFTLEEQIVLRRFLLQIRDNLLQAAGEKPWE
ncbi:MAG: MarR family transcriptional regulator [Anaerolineales bacterium]|nr:MarR family transcriptional regulator [Anaerolineales bacterium]